MDSARKHLAQARGLSQPASDRAKYGHRYNIAASRSDFEHTAHEKIEAGQCTLPGRL
jgi:hypothetical protein